MKDCGPGRYRNPATNRCKKKVSINTKPKKTKNTSCGAGKEKNPNTGRCRKSCTASQVRNKQGKCVKHTVRRHKSPKRPSPLEYSSPLRTYVVTFRKSYDPDDLFDDDFDENELLYEFYDTVYDALYRSADAELDPRRRESQNMYSSKGYFDLPIYPLRDAEDHKYNKANIVKTIKNCLNPDAYYTIEYQSIK